MSDVEDRLRDALRELAPTDPRVDGLASGAWRRHTRQRRRRRVAAGVAAVAVLAGTAAVMGLRDRPAPALPSGPVLTPGDCTSIPRPTAAGGVTDWDPASAPRLRAAWICPDPSATRAGDGWELPLAPLTGRYAQMVPPALRPPGEPSASTGARAGEGACGNARSGPAFTLTQQTEDGLVTTYRSTDDMCDGVAIIDFFLVALADQEADARAASAPDRDLACRTDQAWVDGPHGTSLDSPLVTARLCFAPNHVVVGPRDPTYLQPMSFRSYRSALIPPATLALLNRDMSAAAYYRGNGECSMEGPWSYSVLGRTVSGQYRKLRTGCLDELFVTGAEHFGFDVSPDTTAGLRALVPPG